MFQDKNMSVRSLNKVMLIGNLTRDPELRYTPSGTAVCNFGLATNRQWTSADGTTQEATEFHRIVAWAKLAEICSQLLFKGRKVYIEGRLQTREWTAADGTKQRTTEVVCDTMMILDSKRREGVGVGEEMPMEEVVAPVDTPEEEVKPTGAEATAPAVEEVETPKAAAKPKTTKAAKKKREESKEDEGKKEKEEVRPEDLPF